MLAFLLEEGDRCQTCGTKASEWEADKFAYIAEPHWCPGCYAMDGEQHNTRQALPGTTVRLSANTPVKQAQRVVDEKRRAKLRALDQE